MSTWRRDWTSRIPHGGPRSSRTTAGKGYALSWSAAARTGPELRKPLRGEIWHPVAVVSAREARQRRTAGYARKNGRGPAVRSIDVVRRTLIGTSGRG